jgi:hypothetical protein
VNPGKLLHQSKEWRETVGHGLLHDGVPAQTAFESSMPKGNQEEEPGVVAVVVRRLLEMASE